VYETGSELIFSENQRNGKTDTVNSGSHVLKTICPTQKSKVAKM
jgi:hypothetical protein